MKSLFLTSGSPIAARATFPIITFFLILFSIALFIILLWLLFKKIDDYHKSEKYLEKEKNRLTNKKDIANIAKYYHIPKAQENILWEICQLSKCKNFSYVMKDTNELYDLFKSSYETFVQNSISDIKLNNFFNLLYKLETIAAQAKTVSSTKILKIGSVVFYLNSKGEKFPMYVIKNTNDSFSVEMPEFLYNSERRPKLLEKQRFVIKTDDGITFSFISRIMRYEQTAENQCLMLIAHSDKLNTTVQRHYRREFFEEMIKFSAVKFKQNNEDNKDIFIYSDKIYDGKLTNISAGGCCIETNLPVKEYQHICLYLDRIGISEKVIGVIKRTRKLEDGNFALHIQFVKISLESKNILYTLVYKYQL